MRQRWGETENLSSQQSKDINSLPPMAHHQNGFAGGAVMNGHPAPPTVAVPTHARTNGSCVKSSASSSEEKHYIVAAIDFGTTYSGYAFSFVRDSDSIHMMRKWEGGDPGVSNQKTPTTLLLRPNGEFHSFGFGARDHYHDLEEVEAKKWYYFEKFKMSLHSSHVSAQATPTSSYVRDHTGAVRQYGCTSKI